MAPDVSTPEITDLERWLETLPTSVSYDEPEKGGFSRQQYLNEICRVTEPNAVIVVYLQDHDQYGNSFLTIAYAAPSNFINTTDLPLRIDLSPLDDTSNFAELSKNSFQDFCEDHFPAGHLPQAYILPAEGKLIPLGQGSIVLHSQSSGLAIVFLPSESQLTHVTLMQLEIARRQYFAEIARSRQERIATALNSMLAILSHDAVAEKVCELFRNFCRATSVLIFERRGDEYVRIALDRTENESVDLSGIPVDEIASLIGDGQFLRSHIYKATKPATRLIEMLGDFPWMLGPCLTAGINVISGTDTRYPQYLILARGKQKADYLGNDFSLTDLSVAESLSALLSSHLPYINFSKQINDISKELDESSSQDLSLSWLFELAKSALPGLHSIAMMPEFPRKQDTRFEPVAFAIDVKTIFSSEVGQRGNISCLASSARRRHDLKCMIYNVSTQYRESQKIVFAFEDQYLQNAHLQTLELFVEHVRSVCNVIDSREYHNATQAQIRHVIRGSLTAAIWEIELIANRVRLFEGMPTKLFKLMRTPTMVDSVEDTLLWLNEAYSLADAPRYLLDTFDKNAIRWSDVNPVSLVNEILKINRGEIRRRGLRVEMIIDPAMENRTVSADPQFLKIVFFNLIDNAVKYSFQDRRLIIELSYLETSKWRFEVNNIGVPIDPTDRDKIFDPWVRSFRQYFTTRRPGTGLGLAVSRRILEAHDEHVLFDFRSELQTTKPLVAETSFFFELDAKGKGEPSRT